VEEMGHRAPKGSDAADDRKSRHRRRKSSMSPTNTYRRKVKNLRRSVFFIFTS
jgi:hypothetical protein